MPGFDLMHQEHDEARVRMIEAETKAQADREALRPKPFYASYGSFLCCAAR